MSVLNHPQIVPASELRANFVPFDNGDRMTRVEFHRLYELMPDMRAELIEGVVFMSSPVSVKGHRTQTIRVATLVGVYHANSFGTQAADNSTCILDLENEYRPDIFLRIDESVGGQSKLVGEYIHGAPELIVEVADSSHALDLHKKLDVYRRVGVKEYVVWVVRENRFACFRATEEVLVPVELTDGLFVSTFFPGLVMNTTALITGDLAAALATLQAGIASPEHAAFVAALQARRIK